MPDTLRRIFTATLITGKTGCVSGDTELRLNRALKGYRQTIAQECLTRQQVRGPARHEIPTFTRSLLGERIGLQPVRDIVYSGVRPTYFLRVHNGPTLRATADHGILTPDGFVPLGDLRPGQEVCGERPGYHPPPAEAKPRYHRVSCLWFHPYASRWTARGVNRVLATVPAHRLVAEAALNGLEYGAFVAICRQDADRAATLQFLNPAEFAVHHRDRDPFNNKLENLQVLTHQAHQQLHGQSCARNFGDGRLGEWRVLSVEARGEEDTFDVQCPDPYHNFVANGLVVHNSGKTSLSATLADYLWETYHRVLLLASCDGGAVPTVVQRRIQQGLIRFWRMRTRSAKGLAFETCYLASKGYWPAQINPVSGETDPAVPLVPPITVAYTLTCKEGHLITKTTSPQVKPHFCSTCKKMYSPAEIVTEETAKQTRGFEQVGGLFFDGLTSACGWFMEDMDERRGAGDITGGEGTALGKGTIVRSGQQSFGGNNKADYGFAQTRARQLVSNSLGIPNLVEGPVFTALTLEIPDEQGVRVVGPQLVGKAMSDVMPQWFGGVFEAAVIVNADQQKQRRLYLEPYTDEQGRDHLLKNASNGTLPPYLEDPPKGDRSKMFSQFNLGLVFKLLDEDLRESLKDAGETEGVAAPTTYGGEESETQTSPAQSQGQGSGPEGAAVPRPTGQVQKINQAPQPIQPAAQAPRTPQASEPVSQTSQPVTLAAPPAVAPPASAGARRPIARPIARGRVPQTSPVPETPQTTVQAVQEPVPAQVAVPVQVQQPSRPPAVPPPPGMKPPMRAPGV